MWVLGMAFLVDALDQNVVRGIVPQLKPAFHVGDFGIGIVMSAFVLVNGIVTLPAGYLADRWTRTRAVAGTIALWSVASAAGALAPTFGILVLLRGTLGFGQAVTDPSTSSLLPDYYARDRRGRAFSVQQSLSFVGTGVGVLIGGLVGSRFGWRPAFVLVSVPGLVVAALSTRLREPVRGAADRVVAGQADEIEYVERGDRVPLFAEGVTSFARDLWAGLRADVATLVAIRTMRYALAGVASLLFVVTAVGSWMTEFYIRNLGLSQAKASTAFLVLVVVGGIPGVLVGGRIADRFVTRVAGARVVIPGVAILCSTTLFIVSMARLPVGACLPVQILAFFAATVAIPSLRAGLADAVPSTLRGTGFSAFNLASVLFGTAAAPVVTSFVSEQFGSDLRTAFLVVIPVAYVGAFLLLAARRHLEADTNRLIARVVALQE